MGRFADCSRRLSEQRVASLNVRLWPYSVVHPLIHSLAGKGPYKPFRSFLDFKLTHPTTDKARENVEKFGWHCVHVLPQKDEGYVPFAYTIGLVESLNHPEIVIFGLGKDTAHGILSDCVNLIRDGTVFPTDDRVPDILAGDYDVQFRPVQRRYFGEYLGHACRFYGADSFEALVLFWPDKAGQFPWESKNPLGQREALKITEN